MKVSLFAVKHLWDERPLDWPEHIPFKDPNNANKDGKYFIVVCLNMKLNK